ncbi:MAG TPA: MscL family protein, partial [Paracoccus sp. (in: a-proteobacteria)]|nr:MscL family protein [Paracoccus sp. (in: a-proteobacteria)]
MSRKVEQSGGGWHGVMSCLIYSRNTLMRHIHARERGKVIRMIKEFKEFIAKGNVMDMAVGIIIGA